MPTLRNFHAIASSGFRRESVNLLAVDSRDAIARAVELLVPSLGATPPDTLKICVEELIVNRFEKDLARFDQVENEELALFDRTEARAINSGSW